ncbi:Cu,Zn superoxide dismutase-like protein [Thozetella sp. PMI_491]|nr:Cu,Zn superoxide dismutase-like protein [Thozetella sp. PMI_491]
MLARGLLSLSLSALVAAQTTGKLGDAKEVTTNPAGVTYGAWFNTTHALGWFNATSSTTGVDFMFDVDGLPTDGPLKYHIHVNPVPADGNCTATGSHLDPFQREDTPACDATKPESCQVGDLSGKHGTTFGPMAMDNYNDKYVALDPKNAAFFGNRSVVFHDKTSARIACANFKKI